MVDHTGNLRKKLQGKPANNLQNIDIALVKKRAEISGWMMRIISIQCSMADWMN